MGEARREKAKELSLAGLPYFFARRSSRRINFSCLKMFFTACVLGSLRFFKLKTIG